jgi:WbqC-like protein family
VRISIIQSCYIPWKGFFDLIGQCDEYVIYDSAQYVKRHWHNRNRIKTATGVQWLTIPVLTGGRFDQSIETVEIEKPWADKHWRTLELAYKGAPFFEQVAPTVKGWYARAYFDEQMFAAAGIAPEWMSYEGYPKYSQLYGPFEHAVTTLDVLFNAAPDAPRLIQRVSERKQPV